MKLFIRSMEHDQMRHSESEEDLLDKFELMSQVDGDDIGNSYTEWFAENIMDQGDGRPDPVIVTASQAGINVDTATENIMMSARNEETSTRHMHVQYPPSEDDDNPNTTDSGGDDGDGDETIGDGSHRGGDGGGYHDGGGGQSGAYYLSPFTGEDEYTHATQDSDHGSRQAPSTSRNRAIHARGRGRTASERQMNRRRQRMQREMEDNISQQFSSMEISSSDGWGGRPNSASSSSYGYSGSEMSAFSHIMHNSSFPPLGILHSMPYEQYHYYVTEFLRAYQTSMTWEQYCAHLDFVYASSYQVQEDFQLPRHSNYY